jgi:hypothetical protein
LANIGNFTPIEAEFRDLLAAARFLAAEIIGRETQHYQPALAVFRIQRLQPFVLAGIAAVAGGIDHQRDLAGVLAQVLRRIILQALERVIEQRRAGGPGGGLRRGSGGQAGPTQKKQASQKIQAHRGLLDDGNGRCGSGIDRGQQRCAWQRSDPVPDTLPD